MIYQLEARKYEAVSGERFDSARKLKESISGQRPNESIILDSEKSQPALKGIYSFTDLETVGLQLGAMEMEKKILVSKSDFDGAKVKREEMDTLRDEAYR